MATTPIRTVPPTLSSAVEATQTEARTEPAQAAPPTAPVIPPVKDRMDPSVAPAGNQPAPRSGNDASQLASGPRLALASQMSTAQGAQLRNISGIVSEAVQLRAPAAAQSLQALGLTPSQASLVSQAAARRAAKTATWALMWSGLRPGSELRAMEAVERSVTRTVVREASKFVEVAATQVDGAAAAIGGLMAQPAAAAGASLTRIDKGIFRQLVPGLNFGFIAWDFHKAIQLKSDPKATRTQKVAGWVTFLASAAAATNFPIVSWGAIIVSVVGSFVRDNPDPIAGLDSLVSSVATQFTPATPQPQ